MYETAHIVLHVRQSTAYNHLQGSIETNPESLQPAPFLKWVGGKGRLLNSLLPLLPANVDRMRHVEPFAGGAAMFFARNPERAVLADVNHDLVLTYNAVRDDVEGVIGKLGSLARGHSSEHYYAVRAAYNSGARIAPRAGRPASKRPGNSPALRAAQFIYLNKTCFNGLHRVNRRGEFNVPAGRYSAPRILNEGLLRAASNILARTEVKYARFEELVEYARPGDFVYLDPPYEPVSDTANFTAYTSGGFSRDDQTRLRDVVRVLDRRGCKVMLSNNDVPFIREIYREFDVTQVFAPRAVNSDASARGLVPEVVVRNYT